MNASSVQPDASSRQVPAPSDARATVRRMAAELLASMSADYHPEFGGGAMTATAYDTAWVAMVRDHRDPEQLAFPLSLAWLLAHQEEDGSFSPPFPYTLIPTLAALLAFRKSPGSAAARAAERAEAYIRRAIDGWSVNKFESIAFEVITPALLLELEAFGVALDFPAKAPLLKLFAEKLSIAGPELLYSGHSNLLFSLEAFAGSLDYERLRSQQADNGNFGCSPSSTAAALIHGKTWNPRAARWLTHLTERRCGGHPGGMPNAFSIDTFEASWVLYNLANGGFDLRRDFPGPAVPSLVDWLRGSLSPQGASFSRFSRVPADADDTGVVLAALNLAGEAMPADALLSFERDADYACFERERGASPSANAHALAALLTLSPERRAAVSKSVQKLVEALYDARHLDGSWQDKWHSSPYYATACSVLALAADENAATKSRLRPTVDWILETQASDGGWGYRGDSTLEETAYAMQVLQAASSKAAFDARLEAARARGARHLWVNLADCHERRHAKLWLGKELYAPSRVILSAVLGALQAELSRSTSAERMTNGESSR